MIELVLICVRFVLGLLGGERSCFSYEHARARTEIVGTGFRSSRVVSLRDDMWLSSIHVLGRFGAPPGRYRDDRLILAVGLERGDRKRDDSADPEPVLRQNERL